MRVFILITLLICSSADKHIHNIFNSLQVENVKVTIDPQVEIVAGPSLDQKGSVFVSWTGVMNPKRTDWVGVYSPPQADITKISPVKFKFVVVRAESSTRLILPSFPNGFSSLSLIV